MKYTNLIFYQKSLSVRLTLLFTAMLIFCSNSFSQNASFTMTGIDATEFPTIKAGFIALKPDGNSYRDLTTNDFRIKENSVEVKDFDIECQDSLLEPEVYVLLILDQSSSMGLKDSASGVTRWKWVVDGATKFINTIKIVGRTQLAITSFASEYYVSLRCPWTNDKKRLIDSIESTWINGGTNYDSPFLDTNIGAWAMFTKPTEKDANMRRIVIFLTDGQPNSPPKADSIVKVMKKHNIQVYSITMTMDMHDSLKLISTQTGGKYFAVKTKDDLENIYYLIALDIQTKVFCQLIWETKYNCNDAERYRTVEVVFKRIPQTEVRSYVAPINSIAEVDIPQILTFGNPPGNTKQTMQVMISPNVTDYKIDTIYAKPDTTADGWYFKAINLPKFPYILKKFDTLYVDVEFKQSKDRLYRQGVLYVVGLPCTETVNLVGGLGKIKVINPGLVDGEIHSICDTIYILWSGVERETPVRLLYTTDTGANPKWDTISSNATGLEYHWKPPKPNKNYRIKAEVSDVPTYMWATRFGGKQNDGGRSVAISKDNYSVYCVGFFEDSAKFNGNTLKSTGGSDIFITSYSSQGDFAWARGAGGSGMDTAMGVCSDYKGNIYLTGICYKGAKFGTMTADEGLLPNLPYCFVARVSESGTISKLFTFGATGIYTSFQARGLKIRYDSLTSRIFVRGTCLDQVEITGGFKIGVRGKLNEFTLELDELFFVKSLITGGPMYPDYSSDTAKDVDGSKYATGEFTNTQKFGSYELKSDGKKDAYLYKFGTIPGSDYTTRVFAVDAPKLALNPNKLNFGSWIISNTPKTDYSQLMNTGTLKVEIIKTDIIGPDKASFLLTSDPIGSYIEPGQSLNTPLEVSFLPQKAGPLSAKLVIYPDCGDSAVLDLSGVGVCSAAVMDSIDFGDEVVGKSKPLTFDCIFKNTNKEALRITPKVEGKHPNDFKLYYIEGDPIVSEIYVLPDACFPMKVVFTPQGPLLREAYINYTMPGGCEYKQTVLIGNGTDTEVLVESINWGDKRILTVNPYKLKLKNEGSLPIRITDMQFEDQTVPDMFSFTPRIETVPAKSSIDVDVSFSPTTEGIFNNAILISVEQVTSKLRATLKGNGVLPKIKYELLCPDPIKPGETANAYLRISDTSQTAKLVIHSIDFVQQTQNFSWVGNAPANDTIDIGTSKNYQLLFTPQKPGLLPVGFRIISDAKTGPEQEPIDTIIYQTNCEALGVSVDSPIEFGNWLQCDSGRIEVTIYNTGGSLPITITNYEFSNSDGEAFSLLLPLPLVINAGDKRTFFVKFKPPQPRKYITTLRLINSINQELNVELTGTGYYIYYSTPEKTIGKKPGNPITLPVYAKIVSLERITLSDLKVQVIFDPLMVKYAGNINSLRSSLSGFSWDNPPMIETGALTVSGTGNLQTPFDGELFTLDFEIYLGNTKESDIYFKPVHGNCITDDTLATTFLLTDVCNLSGRLIAFSEANFILFAPVPNPASDNVNVKFNIGFEGITKIELINTFGSVVQTYINTVLKPGEYDLNIRTDNIPSGVYNIKMTSGQFIRSVNLNVTK